MRLSCEELRAAKKQTFLVMMFLVMFCHQNKVKIDAKINFIFNPF